MTRRAVVLVLVVAAVTLIGATWIASRDRPQAALDQDADAQVGVRYEYALMTHCGVDFIRFDGRWWEATPHLDDGNGNPPAGWDNGIQQGAIQLVSADELRFEASGGRLLRLVPAAIAPMPQTCM